MEYHSEIRWSEMDLKKDGTPSAKGLRDYEGILQQSYKFPEDSLGEKLSKALALMDEEKELKKTEKELTNQLNDLTEKTIQNLNDEQIKELLFEKWIAPLREGVRGLVDKLFKKFETQLIAVHDKYATTMANIQKEIQKSNKEFIEMMNQLTGSESDMEGIRQFQALLGGEGDE